MRLWTIQPIGFYESSREKGVLRADGRKIGRDWTPQYCWMREQMKKRVPGYKGRYPIWAYPFKPDMRRRHWGIGGQRVARIEFEAPEEKVLVSDYDLWHVPLNFGYLGTSEEDEDAFDREEEERLGRKYARLPDPDYPEDLALRVYDSWERIFPDRWDEFTDPSYYLGSGDPYLQAVVEEVPIGWIRRVDFYTLRDDRYSLEAMRDPNTVVKDVLDRDGNIKARMFKRKRKGT